MRTLRLLRAVCLPALVLAGSVSALAMDEQEQRERILFETREQELQLEKSGLLHDDAEVDAYLQSVIERLFPENEGRYRVRALDDDEFNAFAVASGNLYVNTGALLRIRNEAELAALLGHEGGHVAQDHMYRTVRSAKAVGAVTSILSVGLLVGIGIDPGLSSIAAYSSMAGFSREYERESDQAAFERMHATGYDGAAGATMFERMARELQARQIKQGPYFFASHPKLLERAQNFRELSQAAPGGEMRRDEYLVATTRTRLAALDDVYQNKDGRALVAILGEPGMPEELAPSGYFCLGEGYRLRGEAGDEERALEQYQKSIATYPDFAPAWGALGRYYARKGDKALALEHLDRFLALDPNARDAAFARQTAERLRNEVTP